MSFDAYYGDEYSYTKSRYNPDDSYGYVYLSSSDYSVDFCMPAYDGDNIIESIPLPTVRVGSGQSSLITNWVSENGYIEAVLR